MNIGETIRNYRLQRGMSQGDIEKRTGLLRCYLSRVENGHTIPSLDTLAKIAFEKAGIMRPGVPVLWGGDEAGDADATASRLEGGYQAGDESARHGDRHRIQEQAPVRLDQ